MRIAHIGLASYFTEHMTYQDNQLSNQNVLDGHEVLVISNAAKYADGKVVDTGYEDYYLENGIRLIRLPPSTAAGGRRLFRRNCALSMDSTGFWKISNRM